MTEQEQPAGPPVLTVADKLGETFARHATAARRAGAESEALARHAALGTLATEVHGEARPALEALLAETLAHMPADHPLRPTLELLQSPSNPIVAALFDALGFVGMVLAVVPAIGKIYVQELVNAAQAQHADIPLSPADLANIVVQGILTQPEAAPLAAMSGTSSGNFELLVDVTGMPPAIQELTEMFRRGIIPLEGGAVAGGPSVELGIMQGHTKDMWVQSMLGLAYTWPQPTEFVNAAVREQIDKPTAQAWAGKAGLDITTEVAPGITFFDLAFDVAGRPPGPGEAAHMALRGIIPTTGSGPTATTFQQAIAESDVKTKWTAALWALYQYVPPPGDVKQMLLHGAIDEAQAVKYLSMSGIDADLAGAMLYTAQQEYIAQDKALAKGEIQALYIAGELSHDDALAQLDILGYRGDVALWLLELANVKKEQRILNRQVTAVTNEVVKGWLDPTTGAADLAAMGIPQEEVDWLKAEWAWARTIQRKQLTASQVAKGYQYGAMTESLALAYLQNLGYSQYDAYVLLVGSAEGGVIATEVVPPPPAPWPPKDSSGNIIYPPDVAAANQPAPHQPWPPPAPGYLANPAPFPAKP